MNRAGRRKLGFTEPRFRKFDREQVKWYDDLFKFFHKEEAFKLGNTETLRLDRLEGRPRRWQQERGRRKLLQLIRLENELGINSYD